MGLKGIHLKKYSEQGSMLMGTLFIILALGAALVFYRAELEQLKNSYTNTQAEVEALRKQTQISVSEGLQIEQARFELMRIPTEITFEFKKTYPRPVGAIGFKTDEVHIFYKTDYTFTYGYDLEDWQWCASLGDQPGFVKLRAPKAIWTNQNIKIAPTKWRTINGIFYETQLGEIVQAEVTRMLAHKIMQTAKKHLNDGAMQNNMQRALKQFLVEVMNASHPAGNPVSGVEFVTDMDANCQPLAAES